MIYSPSISFSSSSSILITQEKKVYVVFKISPEGMILRSDEFFFLQLFNKAGENVIVNLFVVFWWNKRSYALTY